MTEKVDELLALFHQSTAPRWLTLGVFLMGALAVVLPSGYSIGALLLLVLSVSWVRVRDFPHLGSAESWVVSVMVAYSLVWMVEAMLRGRGIDALDQPSRLLFASLCLVVFTKYRLDWGVVWVGIALGSIGGCIVALWQTGLEGAPRASGFVGPEHLGNLGALFFGFSVLGGLWFLTIERRYAHALLSAIGGLAALVMVLLSGSRSSWISLLPLLVLAGFLLVRLGQKRLLGLLSLVMLTLTVIAVVIPQSGVVQRITETAEDLETYSEGTSSGSVGQRFQIWSGATQLFQQRPLFGWGERGYRSEMASMADRDVIAGEIAEFNHAHNDWLNVLAKKGIFGAIWLFAVYAVPLAFFTKSLLRSVDRRICILATAGAMLVINFVTHGMAHNALGSNNGVMTYAFWLAAITGGLVERQRQHA